MPQNNAFTHLFCTHLNIIYKKAAIVKPFHFTEKTL